MSDVRNNDEDKLGAVLIEVRDDLRQLRTNLKKFTIDENGKTLDIQALDTAIFKTEKRITKHAEDYLKTVSKQLLVLPIIEDFQNRTVQIPKWKPALEIFPDLCPKKDDLSMASPGETHKLVLAKRLLHNPTHPYNRAIMHQKFGLSLPDVHKRSTNVIEQSALMKLRQLRLCETEYPGDLLEIERHLEFWLS